MTEFGVQLHGTFPMRRYVDLARTVESFAFHELTVHDVVWWRPVWPILTLIAEHTERVHVGPDVTHPYLRHPVDTASCIAALDELSDGRAILGLGAGSMLDRIDVPIARPLVAVRETVELVERLLSRDRTPYEGELFTAHEDAQLFWEPPRPRVPTFVGAYAPRMVAEAPRWVDELRPPGMWAPGFFRDVQRRAREAAADEGFRVGCDVWISLGDDRDDARALGRRLLAQFLPLPVFRPHVEFHDVDRTEIAAVGDLMRSGDVARAAGLVSDATLDTFVAAGTVADVVVGLERLLDAGPSTVTFSGRLGPDPDRALELLGREVLPAVM